MTGPDFTAAPIERGELALLIALAIPTGLGLALLGAYKLGRRPR